ncbi:GNAT family N-acetyltransferase [Vibrio fluvialis]|uniref:GNAT family N-acetyltransferase n=1 Tax=Vibrio fluvialis TaxID=676 RepID=UPI00192B6959|nr:GNAT family N-acetyltransferase [Vibrio fluvialis]MBL4282692.1 GNAT family N-acetyltransferase [Vibrio fluvialis]
MIREAEMRDLEALVNLFIVENRHNANLAPENVRVTNDVLSEQELRDIILDEKQLLLVGEREGMVTGALLGSITNVRERRWTPSNCYAYVEELVVDPSSRRQGVAQQLLACFETWARSQGASSIDLHVWSNNREALGFYDKSGFKTKQHLLSKKLHD